MAESHDEISGSVHLNRDTAISVDQVPTSTLSPSRSSLHFDEDYTHGSGDTDEGQEAAYGSPGSESQTDSRSRITDDTASVNRSAPRAPSNMSLGSAPLSPLGKHERSWSHRPSTKLNSTDSFNPQLQKWKDHPELEAATTVRQTHGIRLRRRNTMTNVEDAHIPRGPLHWKPHHSRRPEHITSPSTQNLLHTNIIPQQEAYILKVCRSLMMYGAPTHRLEEYMQATAEILSMRVQSFYMPGCMIISFNDSVYRSTEVHIVRCTQALNLTKLYEVHAVYKSIIHSTSTLEDATDRLDDIMAQPNKFPHWLRVITYGLASAAIGPVSYSARPVDLPIIFLLGSLLGFSELILSAKSDLYAHIFEISSAILTSFVARAFGSMNSGNTFCFSAIAQASLVLILPGFTVTNSALELQSKNIVSGSVRMIYGIIFTLFLAFGITTGTTIYGALDGNASSATTCTATSISSSFWWQVVFVPVFTFFYIIVNQAPWSKMPTMIILTLSGWLVNHFSGLRFQGHNQLPQALGALTVGILANYYSRLRHGLAVAVLHPAIFIQVPGSLAASGGLIGGVQEADQLTGRNGTEAGGPGQPNTTALNAGYAMVEIAIGITVGLSVSALVVYPFRKARGRSGLFSF